MLAQAGINIGGWSNDRAGVGGTASSAFTEVDEPARCDVFDETEDAVGNTGVFATEALDSGWTIALLASARRVWMYARVKSMRARGGEK